MRRIEALLVHRPDAGEPGGQQPFVHAVGSPSFSESIQKLKRLIVMRVLCLSK